MDSKLQVFSIGIYEQYFFLLLLDSFFCLHQGFFSFKRNIISSSLHRLTVLKKINDFIIFIVQFDLLYLHMLQIISILLNIFSKLNDFLR